MHTVVEDADADDKLHPEVAAYLDAAGDAVRFPAEIINDQSKA